MLHCYTLLPSSTTRLDCRHDSSYSRDEALPRIHSCQAFVFVRQTPSQTSVSPSTDTCHLGGNVLLHLLQLMHDDSILCALGAHTTVMSDPAPHLRRTWRQGKLTSHVRLRSSGPAPKILPPPNSVDKAVVFAARRHRTHREGLAPMASLIKLTYQAHPRVESSHTHTQYLRQDSLKVALGKQWIPDEPSVSCSCVSPLMQQVPTAVVVHKKLTARRRIRQRRGCGRQLFLATGLITRAAEYF
jgi:hypothetical protein